jgi:IS30 family transposase
MTLENITDDEVESVIHKLNHRPRKTLNFKTPHELFSAEQEKEAA